MTNNLINKKRSAFVIDRVHRKIAATDNKFLELFSIRDPPDQYQRFCRTLLSDVFPFQNKYEICQS